MKIYVLEILYRNDDGDLIQELETYFSRPGKFTYIVWV